MRAARLPDRRFPAAALARSVAAGQFLGHAGDAPTGFQALALEVPLSRVEGRAEGHGRHPVPCARGASSRLWR